MRHQPFLPRRWSSDLAYFFGLIVGDGSLPNVLTKRPNGKYQKRHIIYFVSNKLSFLKDIYVPLFQNLFKVTPSVEEVKNKPNVLYFSRIESMDLYLYLVKMGYIPGRKARIAKVPLMPKIYYTDFLAGLLDTDGGKKGNGFGLSTASSYLADFCIKVLMEENIPYHSCPWKYKDHTYHQVYVRKKDMWKILKSINLRHEDKISFIKESMPQ